MKDVLCSEAWLAGKELVKEAEKHLEKLKNTIELCSSGKRIREELADQAEIMKDELRAFTRLPCLLFVFFVFQMLE